MKKFLLSVLGLGLFATTFGQPLFVENFNYSTTGGLTVASGGNTSAGVWSSISGSGFYITATPSALSYTGYTNSGVGNKVVLTATSSSAEDIYASFTTQTSGTVYASFLLNITDTSRLLDNSNNVADLFCGFISSSSTTNFAGRLLIRKGSSATTFQLGVRSSVSNNVSAQTAFINTDYNVGQTYLIVLGYQINSGAQNDSTLLWVNPSISSQTPPVRDVATITNFGTEPTDIGRFLLRQGANTPNASISNIRIATSWNDAPLPVKYRSFSAVHVANGNQVRWTTASEAGNSHFLVQRSINGGRYETIGTVKGAGNSSTNKNYAFTDADKNSGTICYRLKQVDFDGKSELSKISCVSIENPAVSDDMFTTPNPFNRDLNVVYNTQSAEQSANVQLIDMLGKVHYNADHRINKGSNNFDINTEALPLGIYFIRITTGNQVKTQRIIKK